MASSNLSESHEGLESIEHETFWSSIWLENKGAILILISEAFGSCNDAIARYLQQGDRGIHSFQVMFSRMLTTFILCMLYMWWTKVPDFPLGKRSIRHLLVLRSAFGFCGVFCLYYSVHYIPLAEATVFRFLVPIVTAYACSVIFGVEFTRKTLIAGLIAILGVIMIAQPATIFGHDDSIHADGIEADGVTHAQRLVAIIVSLAGVLGASGAYTTIRGIGNQAHPLISVCYFSAVCTVGSTIGLVLVPGIGFIMPATPLEWALNLLLGIFGFSLQFLLTAGLQLDRSSKATSMMYTQVLFALTFDWVIWGVLPGGWSLTGGAIVIASTLWSALQKTKGGHTPTKSKSPDEENPLLGGSANGVADVVRRGSMSV